MRRIQSIKSQVAIKFLRYKTKGFMPKNSRAQAAMEFLMTYGWALLVVLIAIAALAFFGLLNPSRFLPQKADLGSGLIVSDAYVDEGKVVLIVYNGLGETLSKFNITVDNCEDSPGISDSIIFPAGTYKTIEIFCNVNTPVNSRFFSVLKAAYSTRVDGYDMQHIKIGEIRWNVQVRSISLHDGLVGYWPLDETSGTTIYDFSGNGNHGTTVSSPLMNQNGKVEKAISFTGTSYINIPSSDFLKPIHFTYSLWVNRTSTGLHQLIATKRYHWSNAPYNSFIFDYTDSNYRFCLSGTDNVQTCIDSNVNLFNEWVHLATTYDGSIVNFYVNGVLVNSLSYSKTIIYSNEVMRLGYAGGWTFGGLIDEVALWNRSLSGSEVKMLYNNGQGISLKS
jgi:hypothetical protein